MTEEIVPLCVSFKSNSEGSFRKLIKKLGAIGVNLKLITPVDLGIALRDTPSYDILFDIANTKLSGLSFNSITSLVKSLVNDIEEIIEEIKPILSCEDSRKINHDLEISTIQEESYNIFKNIIIELISKSEDKFKECASYQRCNLQNENCLLKNEEQRSIFKDLLEKSENLINDKIVDSYDLRIIVLKTIILTLKKNLSEQKFTSRTNNCNCKKELKIFYAELSRYLKIGTRFKLSPPK